jgi:Rrf2 family protein
VSKIVEFSEASNIGLHAMILIALAENGMNVLDIAEKTGASKYHIAKVMQRLAKENLVSSTRGPKGGFALRKHPSEINLLEIYECIEGKIVICNCLFDHVDHDMCPFAKCFMSNLTQTMLMHIKDYLNSRTLDSYLE